jgi:hypothetical protein
MAVKRVDSHMTPTQSWFMDGCASAHGAADKLIIQAPSLHIYMAVVNKHEEVTLSQKKKKKKKML